MKTSNMNAKENGKEEEEEACKGNQSIMMNSATLKGKANEKEEEEKAMSMWDCGSPLYDSYELVSLNHLIDRNLMAFPSLHGSSKSIISNTFTHHSHDMEEHIDGNPEKSKGSFMVTSLSKFSVKIMRKRKNNENRMKKNKKTRKGLGGFLVDLLCLGSK